MTGRGLRGQRIGEAKNPGPVPEPSRLSAARKHGANKRRSSVSSPGLKALNLNINSLLRHREELVPLLRDNCCDFALLQETGVTCNQMPGMINWFHRQGWQFIGLPAASLAQGGKGGVAIVAKEPLTLSKTHQVTLEQGQVMGATLHGASVPLSVVVAYRRPGPGLETLPEIVEFTRHAGDRPWCLGGDFNMNPHTGALPEALQGLGARVVATSGHLTSRTPTDSVWVSGSLSAGDPDTVAPLSDHYGTLFSLQVQHARDNAPAWEFRKPRRVVNPEVDCSAKTEDSWRQHALPQQAWDSLLREDNVAELWNSWSRNAEACLTDVGYFQPDARAHRRGEIPQLQSGAGRMAEGQDTRERQLRRALRRLHEARGNALHGRATSRNLLQNIEGDARRFQFVTEARNRQWWPAIDKLTALLNQFLNDQQSARSKAWRLRVQDYSAAVRWSKELGRPPWLLRCTDGSVCSGRSNGARALKRDWRPVFYGDRNYVPDTQAYLDRYGEWFPQRPVQQDLDLSPAKLRRAVKDMKHKAAGPDNWEARSLLQLPDIAWERLGQLLQSVERTGVWPPGLRAWRLCFIPKDSSTGITDTLKTRPISIGSIIYRAWARVRFQEATKHLPRDVLGELQCGGLKGHDPETLLLALGEEAPSATHAFGCSLDFQKAFDSADWPTAWALLQRCGIAVGTLRALRGMWSGHTRWFACGNHVDPEPLTGVPALMQGDSWAPLAMALVLSGPHKHACRQHPRSCQTLFLDDRTSLHTCLEDLQGWQQSWREFERLGRLRTHPGKIQIWGRTAEARRVLAEAGYEVSDTMTALGATLGPAQRHLSEAEQQRQTACKARAFRVGLLPCGVAMKQRIAATVLTPMFSWATGVCGRWPTRQDQGVLKSLYCRALRGPYLSYGRAAPGLRNVLSYGHGCDASLCALVRVLRAVQRWMTQRAKDGKVVLWSAATRSKAQKVLSKWGDWQVSALAVTKGHVQFSLSTPGPAADKALHELRTDWRCSQLSDWKGADRIDSGIARGIGLSVTPRLVQQLRAAARNCTGSELGVLTGGFKSPAVDFSDGGSILQSCPFCQLPRVPTLEHVLWHCSHFNDLRLESVQKPACPLGHRLGWSNQGVLPCLAQMGGIRERICRLTTSQWRRQGVG